MTEDATKNKPTVRLLHLGNSIQYYNDCPSALQQMLIDSGHFAPNGVTNKRCLRGGSDLVSLHQYGTHWLRRAIGADYGVGTVQELFEDNKDEADYCFAIFNDHTQGPARSATREASLQALEEVYVPYLKANKAVTIFVETAAYRKDNAHGTQDLGDFDAFTKLVQEGYSSYQQKLQELLPDTPCYIAGMGTAHQEIRNNSDRAMWERLYSGDNKHPSPHGTLQEAYLLYLIILKHIGIENYSEVPKYKPEWLKGWFWMPVPTQEEAYELLKVAKKVFAE